MNTRTITAAAVLLISTGAAFARSFELMFVVDAGSKSIKRFDPLTGIYLGEMGNGLLVNPRGITYCSDNTIAVVDAINSVSAIKRFDADTGLFLGQQSVNAGGSLWGIDQGGDGNLYAVEDHGLSTTAKVWKFSSNLSTAPTALTTVVTSAVQPRDIKFYRTPYSQSAYIAGLGGFLQFNLTNQILPTVFGAPQQLIYAGDYVSEYGPFISLTAAGAVNPTSFSGSLLSSCRDVEGGHEILYASGLDLAGNGTVARYDTSGFAQMSIFGQGYLIDPTYVAVHSAPEPASLAALGLGLAALLKKRRSR